MAATPLYSLRYPALTDRPTGDEQLQALAEDTEQALTALVPDSGLRTDTPVTPASGWSPLVLSHRTVGKVCSLFLSMRHDGPAINANSAGNIGDVDFAQINDLLLRPSIQVRGGFRSTLAAGSFQIDTGGLIRLSDLHSGSVIAQHDDDEGVNSTVQLYCVYPVD